MLTGNKAIHGEDGYERERVAAGGIRLMAEHEDAIGQLHRSLAARKGGAR